MLVGLRALLQAVLRVVPEPLHQIARLFVEHGTADEYTAVRELVSNAVDSSLEVSTTYPPSVGVTCHEHYVEVRDDGGGFDDDVGRLLLTPATTSKPTRSTTIGRMGIGFLTAMGSVHWAHVVTRSANRSQDLLLGEVPPLLRLKPRTCRGTTIRIGLSVPLAPGRLRRELARSFPAIRVPVTVDDVPIASARDPFLEGNAAAQGVLGEILGLEHPAWTHASIDARGETSMLVWALGRPCGRGGSLFVLQNGASLGITELPALHGADGAPMWLAVVLSTAEAPPLTTRQGIAAGDAKDRLLQGVREHLERLLGSPPAELVARLPRLQQEHGDEWWAFLESLPANHALRLETTVEARGGTTRLHRLIADKSEIHVIHGSSMVAELLWQELERGAVDAAYVRLPSELAARVVVETLDAAGCPARIDALERGLPSPFPTNPLVGRLAQRLEARLGSLDIFVQVTRMRSSNLIGVMESVSRPTLGLPHLDEARDLYEANVARRRVLVLNESSTVVAELARRWADVEMPLHRALMLVAVVIAGTTAQLGPMPELGQALLTQCGDSASRRGSSRIRTHAQLMYIGPFADTAKGSLGASRAVFENAPWYLEVMRADDWIDAPELWADVVEKIEQTDGFIVDLRHDNRNVWIELGYAMATLHGRPMILMARSESDVPADLRGHLVVVIPREPESTSEWITLLRAQALRQLTLSPERFSATEPFLAHRMVSSFALDATSHLFPSNLWDFARRGIHEVPVELRPAHQELARRLHAFRSSRFGSPT